MKTCLHELGIVKEAIDEGVTRKRSRERPPLRRERPPMRRERPPLDRERPPLGREGPPMGRERTPWVETSIRSRVASARVASAEAADDTAEHCVDERPVRWWQPEEKCREIYGKAWEV